MAKVGAYQIPFGKDGSLLSYPGYGQVEWRDNHEFYATLKFDHFSRGRSSALAIFKDGTGKSFPMFLTCLKDVMPHLLGGSVDGRFTFTKRGENYSVMLVRVNDGRITTLGEAKLRPMLQFAVDGWNSEVKDRPLFNVHRARLDAFWRRAASYAGGDPDALFGPDHETLVAASEAAA